MKTKNNKPGTYSLRGKLNCSTVETRYEDICSITAIRMALKNLVLETAVFKDGDFYLDNAISHVNDCISYLGFKIVRSED